MQAMNKFQVAKEDSVLFSFNQDKLTTDAKAKLDEIAQQATGMDRYVIELQGFTDKSGSPTYNENLSEARVQAVARYMANEHQIPVRNISMLGAGYARPRCRRQNTRRPQDEPSRGSAAVGSGKPG